MALIMQDQRAVDARFATRQQKKVVCFGLRAQMKHTASKRPLRELGEAQNGRDEPLRQPENFHLSQA